MNRSIAIVGAPTSIGIKPYDSGEARHLDQAPGVFRQLSLVERLGATDLGDIIPAPYRDYVRPPGGTRNASEVAAYCRELGAQVGAVTASGAFALVLGGDCSVVLGSLLGARLSAGRIGLVYVDAHSDFATPEESRTGSAASMCLGLAVGRGPLPLSGLAGDAPLVRGEDVVVIGRRDAAQPWHGHAAFAASKVLDIPDAARTQVGFARATAIALDRVTAPELGGFWIHVDADVLNPSVMPAVDSPEPGGPDLEELRDLLAPMVRHPRALGLELTIYDPALDPDRACARRLVSLLEDLLT